MGRDQWFGRAAIIKKIIDSLVLNAFCNHSPIFSISKSCNENVLMKLPVIFLGIMNSWNLIYNSISFLIIYLQQKIRINTHKTRRAGSR